METKNHITLAKYLIQILDHPILNQYQRAFILGNIVPDINILTYLHGHNFESFYYLVQQKMTRIIHKKQWNQRDVYDLGIITHYIADCFTYPHNRQYSGSLVDHCEYERKLQPLFNGYLQNSPNKGTFKVFLLTKKEELLQHIEHKHQEYLEKRTSLLDDCYYIVSTSGRLLQTLSDLNGRASSSSPIMIPVFQEVALSAIS